jgi:hypothetical protein
MINNYVPLFFFLRDKRYAIPYANVDKLFTQMLRAS